MVCFLIPVTFIGSLVHQFIGITTVVPLNSFTSEALTVLYTVVFSFNLLLPICQRTWPQPLKGLLHYILSLSGNGGHGGE